MTIRLPASRTRRLRMADEIMSPEFAQLCRNLGLQGTIDVARSYFRASISIMHMETGVRIEVDEIELAALGSDPAQTLLRAARSLVDEVQKYRTDLRTLEKQREAADRLLAR